MTMRIVSQGGVAQASLPDDHLGGRAAKSLTFSSVTAALSSRCLVSASVQTSVELKDKKLFATAAS